MTTRVESSYDGPRTFLGDVLVPEDEVPEGFFVDAEKIDRWRYFKGGKSEPRIDKKTGFEYRYTEGAMAFPDPVDSPARTILTSEGGGLLPGANILLRLRTGDTAVWYPMSWISCRASRRAGQIPA